MKMERADEGGDRSLLYRLQTRGKSLTIDAFQRDSSKKKKGKFFVFAFLLPPARIQECASQNFRKELHIIVTKRVFLDLSSGNKKTPHWHDAKQGLGNAFGLEFGESPRHVLHLFSSIFLPMLSFHMSFRSTSSSPSANLKLSDLGVSCCPCEDPTARFLDLNHQPLDLHHHHFNQPPDHQILITSHNIPSSDHQNPYSQPIDPPTTHLIPVAYHRSARSSGRTRLQPYLNFHQA